MHRLHTATARPPGLRGSGAAMATLEESEEMTVLFEACDELIHHTASRPYEVAEGAVADATKFLAALRKIRPQIFEDAPENFKKFELEVGFTQALRPQPRFKAIFYKALPKLGIEYRKVRAAPFNNNNGLVGLRERTAALDDIIHGAARQPPDYPALVQPSELHRLGLFANAFFKDGQQVIQLEGEPITAQQKHAPGYDTSYVISYGSGSFDASDRNGMLQLRSGRLVDVHNPTASACSSSAARRAWRGRARLPTFRALSIRARGRT